MIDVGKTVGAHLVVGLRNGVAQVRHFIRLETISNPHFVQVSVCREGEQAGVLVFPTKATDGSFAGSFKDRNSQRNSADLAMALAALLFRDIHERLVRNSFDETVAQQIQRHPKGADLFCVGHSLLDISVWIRTVGTDGAIVHQGASGDDFLAVSDWNRGVLELAMAANMANPGPEQLRRNRRPADSATPERCGPFLCRALAPGYQCLDTHRWDRWRDRSPGCVR